VQGAGPAAPYSAQGGPQAVTLSTSVASAAPALVHDGAEWIYIFCFFLLLNLVIDDLCMFLDVLVRIG
jgi:hypothetical protein